MLKPGERIQVAIEKPAAGGRMIARHDGQVVLVAGAVPGERVVARVERVDRNLAFAAVADVQDASPDRRAPFADPRCGGCVYSHIAYPRQVALKADVLRDAFLRIGRIPLEADVRVAPSPERGHRMRARLHVQDGRVGFYREGTHSLCDPSATGQLTEAALATVRTAVEAVHRAGGQAQTVELTENVPGDTRALSIGVVDASQLWRVPVAEIADGDQIAGVVIHDQRGQRIVAGDPGVADRLSLLTNGLASEGELRRHPESFFQSNRFLVSRLVGAVLDEVPPDGKVLDLYAGVGLFAVSLAAAGRVGITAVEGDRASGADLQRNAGPFGDALTLALESVESALGRLHGPVETVIVDPPRTGISPSALDRIVQRRAGRVVYVSCDPATLARDARKLVDAGYSLESLRGFDLFPNTPHVESLGVFRLTAA
jgi:23S rRNA (uracil1939-C5)-methyltransferase